MLTDFDRCDWGASSDHLGAALDAHLLGPSLGEAEHDMLPWNELMAGLEDLPHM